jgi:hypothetical protein
MANRVGGGAAFGSAEFYSIKHHAMHTGALQAYRGQIIDSLPIPSSVDPTRIAATWYGKPREHPFGACILRLIATLRTMLVRLSAWDIRWNGSRFAVPHALTRPEVEPGSFHEWQG